VVIARVTVVPLGTSDTSLSKYVAACQQVLENRENIEYELTSMGTILEGDLDEIIQTVRELHEVPFKEGALRVSTSLTIDDRRDKKASRQQKIQSVKNRLK